MSQNGIIIGEDGKKRCWWCGDDAEYVRYHDEEWGKHVYDDVRLFEKITLEGFQSGLSWITILRKRAAFRDAFDQFDFHKIATYTDKDVERLLQNAGIIRHRGKIEAAINNAKCAIALIEEKGSLSNYFWSFKPQSHQQPANKSEVVGKTDESAALSKDLKKRGWKFVGPTTCYAFMQSMGIVNDHIKGCHTE